MTMHATVSPSDRILLPRGLIARSVGQQADALEALAATMAASPARRRRIYRASPWRFSVGQTVRLGMLPSVILRRRRTALGREVYNVRIIGENHGREYRDVLGTALALEPSSDPSHSKSQQDT